MMSMKEMQACRDRTSDPRQWALWEIAMLLKEAAAGSTRGEAVPEVPAQVQRKIKSVS